VTWESPHLATERRAQWVAHFPARPDGPSHFSVSILEVCALLVCFPPPLSPVLQKNRIQYCLPCTRVSLLPLAAHAQSMARHSHTRLLSPVALSDLTPSNHFLFALFPPFPAFFLSTLPFNPSRGCLSSRMAWFTRS